MAMMQSRIMGFGSPARYIQGPGVFEKIAEYSKLYGKKAFVLIDTFFYQSMGARLKALYDEAEIQVETTEFGGEATDKEIDRVTAAARGFGADVIVGIGGGKTMDTAQSAASNLGCIFISMPTTASTDAATSALAIVYKENGEHSRVNWFGKNPDMVLVDSEIIAKAPVRYLVSGMGDALSTYFEARANAESDTPNYINQLQGGMRRTKTAMVIAEYSYQMLLEDGPKAKIAAEAGAVTPAIENIIEVNTLMSGLGFENTGCAGAHSIADGITKLPAGTKTLHGEKVAFGVLCQLVAENRPTEEVDEVVNFCLDVGLPVTLEDLHIEKTSENIKVIAEASMGSFWSSEPFYVTPEMVENYIVMADALGHTYKDCGCCGAE